MIPLDLSISVWPTSSPMALASGVGIGVASHRGRWWSVEIHLTWSYMEIYETRCDVIWWLFMLFMVHAINDSTMFHVVSNGFVLHCVEHLRCIYCVLLLVGFMSHHTSIMSSGIWMHLASCCWLSHYDICSYHWTMFMTMALNGDQIFLSNRNHPPKLSGWKSVRWSIWQQQPRNDSWNTGHREARCHDVVMM